MTNEESRFGQWFDRLHISHNGIDEKDVSNEVKGDLSNELKEIITDKVKLEDQDSDEAFANEEGEDVFPVKENGLKRHQLIRKSSLFEDDGHKILEELVHGISMKQREKFVKVVKKFLRYA